MASYGLSPKPSPPQTYEELQGKKEVIRTVALVSKPGWSGRRRRLVVTGWGGMVATVVAGRTVMAVQNRDVIFMHKRGKYFLRIFIG